MFFKWAPGLRRGGAEAPAPMLQGAEFEGSSLRMEAGKPKRTAVVAGGATASRGIDAGKKARRRENETDDGGAHSGLSRSRAALAARIREYWSFSYTTGDK